jgi:DNA-binding MarR family transcriptional regulator
MSKQDVLIELCASKAGTMTIRQLAVLAKLREGRWDHGDLARELRLLAPAVTRACDRLEEFGLVFRTDNPMDRRKIFIALTKQGRSFCARYLGRMGHDYAAEQGGRREASVVMVA